MCDLAMCETMITRFEASAGWTFDFARVRLDVSWEAELPIAPELVGVGHAVHVAKMNSQQGINDKFALGTRSAMRAYLNRLEFLAPERNLTWFARIPRTRDTPFAWNCSADSWNQPVHVCRPKLFRDDSARCPKPSGCALSLNSEKFLAFALWRAGVGVVLHQPWAYCKYGLSHGWRPCTRRMLNHTTCAALKCLGYAARAGARASTAAAPAWRRTALLLARARTVPRAPATAPTSRRALTLTTRGECEPPG